MHRLFRWFVFVVVLTSPVLAQRKLGDLVVPVDKDMIHVRVSANTAELNNLAQLAFASHGRYALDAAAYSYDIRFYLTGATQVRVDILRGRGAAPWFSQTVAGTSARNALLRAADVAVTKTNGLGLRGFFAARLAFVGERTGSKEIYVSDLFGGEARVITRDRAYALSPRWSPDGSRILYTSYVGSNAPDIYEIDLRSNSRRVFARYDGTNTGARFSPTGAQVAMVLSGTGTPEIYVASAFGGKPVRKTEWRDMAKSSPCWSPDGSQLVFAMGESSPQLYLMPSSGGTPRRLVTRYGYTAEPDWNPTNSSQIACTVRPGSYQIAVYDLSTGRAQVVSKAPFDGIEPCWLPDGRHLVYTAREARTSVLCILDTVTGRSTSITARTGIGPAMQASVLAAR